MDAERLDSYLSKAEGNIKVDICDLVKLFDKLSKTEKEKNYIRFFEKKYLTLTALRNMYYVYSKNMEYEIKIPRDQVKADSSRNRIVLLQEGETLTAAARNKNQSYPVGNQKDMEDFRKNTGVFAEGRQNKEGYTKSKNQFNNFQQRQHDYAQMEKELLGNI